MDRFAAISAFVTVVETGSFVRASDRLSTSTSTLSRQIAELEQHLGARLLNRTTRKLSLTEGGRAFYERAMQLLAELQEAEMLANTTVAVPRGTLRLTCSHAIAVQQVAPAMASFVARYPEVGFEVSISDRRTDLVEEGFDMAIRVGHVGSDQLVARRLGPMHLWVCAAPPYLKTHRMPRTPADLAGHPAIIYANAPTPRVWRLTDKRGRDHDVRVSGPLFSNGGDLNIAAAIAGLGIICEPDYAVKPAIDAGLLVRLLPQFDYAPGDIWAVYPSRRHLSAKVRLFVDHIVQQFAAAAASKRRRSA